MKVKSITCTWLGLYIGGKRAYMTGVWYQNDVKFKKKSCLNNFGLLFQVFR